MGGIRRPGRNGKGTGWSGVGMCVGWVGCDHRRWTWGGFLARRLSFVEGLSTPRVLWRDGVSCRAASCCCRVDGAPHGCAPSFLVRPSFPPTGDGYCTCDGLFEQHPRSDRRSYGPDHGHRGGAAAVLRGDTWGCRKLLLHYGAVPYYCTFQLACAAASHCCNALLQHAAAAPSCFSNILLRHAAGSTC